MLRLRSSCVILLVACLSLSSDVLGIDDDAWQESAQPPEQLVDAFTPSHDNALSALSSLRKIHRQMLIAAGVDAYPPLPGTTSKPRRPEAAPLRPLRKSTRPAFGATTTATPTPRPTKTTSAPTGATPVLSRQAAASATMQASAGMNVDQVVANLRKQGSDGKECAVFGMQLLVAAMTTIQSWRADIQANLEVILSEDQGCPKESKRTEAISERILQLGKAGVAGASIKGDFREYKEAMAGYEISIKETIDATYALIKSSFKANYGSWKFDSRLDKCGGKPGASGFVCEGESSMELMTLNVKYEKLLKLKRETQAKIDGLKALEVEIPGVVGTKDTVEVTTKTRTCVSKTCYCKRTGQIQAAIKIQERFYSEVEFFYRQAQTMLCAVRSVQGKIEGQCLPFADTDASWLCPAPKTPRSPQQCYDHDKNKIPCCYLDYYYGAPKRTDWAVREQALRARFPKFDQASIDNVATNLYKTVAKRLPPWVFEPQQCMPSADNARFSQKGADGDFRVSLDSTSGCTEEKSTSTKVGAAPAPVDSCERWKQEQQADKKIQAVLRKEVSFEPNKTFLSSDGKQTLTEVAGVLKGVPWMQVTLTASSSAKAGRSCQDLVNGRAKASSDFLTLLGVLSTQIKTGPGVCDDKMAVGMVTGGDGTKIAVRAPDELTDKLSCGQAAPAKVRMLTP